MINPYPYTWGADLVEIEIEPYGERTQSTYLGTAVFLVSTANPFVVLETDGSAEGFPAPVVKKIMMLKRGRWWVVPLARNIF